MKKIDKKKRNDKSCIRLTLIRFEESNFTIEDNLFILIRFGLVVSL